MSFDADYVVPGDVRRAVRQLRAAGVPAAVIAAKLGLPPETVHAILRGARRHA